MVRAHPCFECGFGFEAFDLFWVGNDCLPLRSLRRAGSAGSRCEFSGRHPQTEKDEQAPKDPIHRLVRAFDKFADRWPIQCVDEENPERGTHEHHAEDEYKQGSCRGLWGNDHGEDAEIKQRAFWVEKIIYESLNEPSSIGLPTINMTPVESLCIRSKAHDPKVDEIHSPGILECRKDHDASGYKQPDA